MSDMKTYFAIGHKQKDSAYGFWFPDIEGCFAAGDTYDEAMKNALDVLSDHLGVLLDLGETAPEPRSIDDILSDPEVTTSLQEEGAFTIAVPFMLLTKVKRRVSFNADASVVSEVDRQIAALGMTKTDWWIQAAHQMLESDAIKHANPPTIKKESYGDDLPKKSARLKKYA